MQKSLVFILIISMFFGCSTNKKANIAKNSTKNEVIENSLDVDYQPSEIIQDVETESSSVHKLKNYAAGVSDTPYDNDKLVLRYHKEHFDFWIKYFTQRDRDRFIRFMENADKYRDIVTQILREYQIPEDIFFVGLIESGYNTHVRSRASAVGPWQFIKETGKRYGLRVDAQMDERANIHKSTEAAASYFRDLYNIFGNWELALCGYNRGEYGVINAIRKGNTRDFKELVNRRLLPDETVQYVPKVAAAREIYMNREKYSLPSREDSNEIYTKSILVKENNPMTLDAISKKYQVSLEDVKTLNPDWKVSYVRPNSGGLKVVLPDTDLTKVIATKIQTIEVHVPKKQVAFHRVKRGESLFSIAKKYNVSLEALRRENHLRRTRLLVGQRLELPDGVVKVASVKSKNSTAKASKKVYVVKRGDNLQQIAKKHKTTVGKILALNNLDSKKIYPKQKLYVPTF